jgi:hypothetical protein
VNNERFITPELKEMESRILGAEEKSKALEAKLFEELKEFARSFTGDIQKSAAALAEVDVLCALAEYASGNDTGEDIPAVHMRGFSYVKRFMIVFQSVLIQRERVLSRFDNSGLDMDGKRVYARFDRTRDLDFVRDKHIFRASDERVVQIDISAGVKPLEYQNGGFHLTRKRKFLRVEHMKVLAGAIEKVFAVEWIFNNAASLQIDLEISRHDGVDLGIFFLQNGKLNRRAVL